MGAPPEASPLLLGMMLALLTATGALAQPNRGPPEIVNWRYDEDWSYLSDPGARTGAWWEPLKYIALGDDAYLSTGLELRLRSEQFEDNLWGAADPPDDGYLWLRAMPHVDVHLGDTVRFFGQLIAADARGVEPTAGPADETGVDVLQAFADVRLPLPDEASATVRGGRQLLSYGSERLIGIRYGPNTPLPFDGGVFIVDSGPWRLDGFYARPVRIGTSSFDDATSRTQELWGIYATRLVPLGLPGGIDAYYLGYTDEVAAFNQGAGHERRHTLGLRLFGSEAGWRWNWEAMYQFGSFAGADISAWSIASETGYQFADAALRPQLQLRANIASGDKNPDRPGLQTFNALFPKGKYFGELTPIGPYNIINVHPSAELNFGRGFTLNLAGIAFWRQSRGDGVYDLPGNLIRASGNSRARFIGTQAEAIVGWKPDSNFEVLVSYSRLSAGRFIRETGPARTIHMVGLETTYRF